MTAAVRSRVEVDAPVERVFEVLTSPEWPASKDRRFSDGSTVVRREERADGGVLVAVSRELPAGAPGFVQKLLPKDGRVLQTDEWAPADGDGTRSGTWKVEIAGTPARLGGTMRLEPASGGTAYVLEGSAKVQVPLVGGRVESYVADMAVRLAAKEGELLREAVRG